MSKKIQSSKDPASQVANAPMNIHDSRRSGATKGTELVKPIDELPATNPAEQGPSTTDKDPKVPTWAANAEKYEWSDEYGDVGPAHPALEQMLFGYAEKMVKGDQFNTLTEISVTIESSTQIKPVAKFEDAGLHPVMLRNVQLCKYDIPTPIQAYVLPAILLNLDVIGIAQTGSGKTAAFLVPTLSKLMGKAKKLAAPRPMLARPWTPADGVRAEPLILIVCPTRELATQIFDEARRLCYRSLLRPCVAYGGLPLRDQIDELRKGCEVLIATPGRLKHLMERPNLLTLTRLKYTIVDEADEMIGPDWDDDINSIMSTGDASMDADHVFMMFSATFPKQARAAARAFMADDHVRIRVGRAGSSHTNIIQRVVFVEDSKKYDCLFDLIQAMGAGRTIIFVNSKRAADMLDSFIYSTGLPCTSIHADRSQLEREDALRSFKTGKAPLIVATGVSARGLDIKNVMHVINFELPSADHGGIQEYVHRIGRTARIGNKGFATSFYNSHNEDIAEALTKVLLETHQEIPDFLDAYKPEDGEDLQFDDDTDSETEDGAEASDQSKGKAKAEWDSEEVVVDDGWH